ncbi:MAG: hypothetical protein PHW32_01040 [Bacilli bacterium]|nr:hypothetical protein [Bacilli bacterium]MDD4282626.1 hypothetical protein [Bacilli bacterium]MDD4718657.1 hypothetical protein [Bacilli bacterium]
MNDLIKDTLSLVIIGDENNHEFDGKIKFNGKRDGLFYHRDSLKKIVNDFRNEGYPLGKVDYSMFNEAGFDLINMGHILFCNCTVEDNYFGYVFLPNKLTVKQVESLKKIEVSLQKFESLYLMTIDENDKESFDAREISYSFNVNDLVNGYSSSKTR